MNAKRLEYRTRSGIEEHCRTELDSWLRRQIPEAQLSWQVPDSDPPDYWLLFYRRRFAVEVTEVRDVSVRADGFYGQVVKFCAEIQREALRKGILRGTYGVTGYAAIERFASKKPSLRKLALEYIRTTAGVGSRSEVVLHGSVDKPLLGIVKSADGHPIVAPGWVGTRTMCNSASELMSGANAVLESIRSKVKKLRLLNAPKVLIILYSYGNGTLDEVLPRVPADPCFANYFAVFVGTPFCVGECRLLYPAANPFPERTRPSVLVSTCIDDRYMVESWVIRRNLCPRDCPLSSAARMTKRPSRHCPVAVPRKHALCCGRKSSSAV